VFCMLRFDDAIAAGQTGELERHLSEFSGIPARTVRDLLSRIPTIKRDRHQKLDERGTSDGVIGVISGARPGEVDFAVEEIRALPRRGEPLLIGLQPEQYETAGKLIDWIVHNAGQHFWDDHVGRPFILKVAFLRKGGHFLLEVVVQDGPHRDMIQYGSDAHFGAGFVDAREIRGDEFWKELGRILYRRPKERAIALEWERLKREAVPLR
jgi:hypothetical protein